ncbi:hypothetical protein NHX12_023050 [Muraenolepis orangiensis]|uniref:Hermansky-Pudlak syndrome 6 protein n=1 Tax=Muraenolepis orangiensis TaxID=630683 RepID=A0A9Q0IUL6_9TELE|nr:hypothetical protein NHX12_023050 [Muraenolepis orangiensis]
MTRLERLTDFSDFTRGHELQEFLKQTSSATTINNNNNYDRCEEAPHLSDDVRLSPDGRHVHVILRAPRVGLLTFDRYRSAPLVPPGHQKHLEPRSTRASDAVVDVIYLENSSNNINNNNHDHHNNHNDSDRSTDDVSTLAVVVHHSGRAEFWRFRESAAGWRLLHAADLCNSPRARVASVASCADLIVWCEERPPSESSAGGAPRNNLRYCICKRAYKVVEEEEGEGGGVSLGGVKIALHNNPCFTVVPSGEYVYLLPAAAAPQEKPLPTASRCLLSWRPQRDTFRVSSACKGALLRKKDCPSSPKETDFKRLVTDCLGYLSALDPPEIHAFSPAACGGLFLLLSTGWVTLLQRDGTLRPVYRPADRRLSDPSSAAPSPGSFHAYQDTLALTAGRTLLLIDLRCGRVLEEINLKRDALLYVNKAHRRAPHLLLETGLYVVTRHSAEEEESDPWCSGGSALESGGGPGARLVESVFEEACKYYQQRSLSSTQLTVDKLKKGGMFQAPISLVSILKDYLHHGGRQKASNGAPPGAGGDLAGQDKLLGSLEAELKALVSLEEVKGTLVRAGEKEAEAICESLVQQEVRRLLTSSEPEGEALLYLNSVFGRFPRQAWSATRAVLQLHCHGSASLSSEAPAEVWKTVLGPVRSPGPPANPVHTDSRPQHKPFLDAFPVRNSAPKAMGPALPVFELLCLAVLRFQAGWLPGFLELAQQKQGAGGLSISLASSSWSYSSGRGGGENREGGAPLYKRALSVLHGRGPEADRERDLDLEVELLLVSGRPNAVLQALRILMSRCQWERVTRVAQRFCQQSPLLNKEIFGSLLCEVAQHRDLDPYLDLLWALCPEDLTVTAVLNLVLKTVPAPNPSSSTLPSSTLSSSSSARHPTPFPRPRSAELTVGLLKPLLRKVLQRETKPSQRYADILQSPVFPPATPPRQPTHKQTGPVARDNPTAGSTTPPPTPPPLTPPPPTPPEHQTLGQSGPF